MKTQQDILHGRSLQDVAEAARAYEESHVPFDKRPMKMRARPPRHMMSRSPFPRRPPAGRVAAT